jgi:Rieske Fe-S protein
MGDEQTTTGGANRRSVLLGAGAVGASVVLAGCGGDSGDGGDTGAGGATTGEPAATPTAGGGDADAVAKTSDIPVGGGKVFPDRQVVITQPAAGTFKGFTSKCTHQGCTVESVSGGTINCPCHGSMFAVADGSVKGGPAPSPLPAREVTVQGDEITLA